MPDLWIVVILPCATITDCHIDPAATQVTNVDSVCTAESSKSEASASLLLFNKSFNIEMHLQFLKGNNKKIKPKWGQYCNILTYCPLEHHLCENANVCDALKIRMPHAPPFLILLLLYIDFASYNSFHSSVTHCWTAADNVILIFPRNVLTHRNIRGWGLFQQARFAVMGDGSLYPSENHSRWNLKPSLYHKCSKKSRNEGHSLPPLIACGMII